MLTMNNLNIFLGLLRNIYILSDAITVFNKSVLVQILQNVSFQSFFSEARVRAIALHQYVLLKKLIFQ